MGVTSSDFLLDTHVVFWLLTSPQQSGSIVIRLTG